MKTPIDYIREFELQISEHEQQIAQLRRWVSDLKGGNERVVASAPHSPIAPRIRKASGKVTVESLLVDVLTKRQADNYHIDQLYEFVRSRYDYKGSLATFRNRAYHLKKRGKLAVEAGIVSFPKQGDKVARQSALNFPKHERTGQ